MRDRVCIKVEAEQKYKIVDVKSGEAEILSKEELIKGLAKGEKVRNLVIDNISFGNGSRVKRYKDIKITDGPIGAYYYTSAYENGFTKKQYILNVIIDDNNEEIGYYLMDECGEHKVVGKEAFLNYIIEFGPKILLNGRCKASNNYSIETNAERKKCDIFENRIKERVCYIESQNKYLESIESAARVYSLLDKVAVKCIDDNALEMDVPSGVTIINGDIFKNCNKLSEIFIGDDIEVIINCDNIRTTKRKYVNVN